MILFLHHAEDALTKKHLELFRRHNPSTPVVALTPNSHAKLPWWDYDNMWMYNDTMVYRWFLSPDKIKAKRYCMFDWDTRCDGPVRDYYGDSWNHPAVATTVHDPRSNPGWAWFNHARKNKKLLSMESDFRGLSPMCGTLLSEEALELVVSEQRRRPELWREQNNEFRVATCAHLAGVPLRECGRKTIQPFAGSVTGEGGIVHPVKKDFSSTETAETSFGRVRVVSAAFSVSDEIVRDINASRETYKGWRVTFLGRGVPMKSYVDSKIYALRDHLLKNRAFCEYVLHVDSNDALFVRDYDESALLDAFLRIGADVVFGGEPNCYPMTDMEGLDNSAGGLLRYLNSGFFMGRVENVLLLLEHVIALFETYPNYKKIGFNPPHDQTYFQLGYFSKSSPVCQRIDEFGELVVSTNAVPDRHFSYQDGALSFNGARPFILHCQGNDKHARKRDFMRKLKIPVRG